MEKIGELIKKARLASGLTADQVAARLNFASRTSVYQIEAREHIDFSLLKKIADLYDKPISYFVDYLDTNVHLSSTENVSEEPEIGYGKNEKNFVNEIYTKDQKIIELQDTIIELQREVIDLTKKLNS